MRPATRRATCPSLVIASWLSAGCGGGAAMLHPAHALPEGRMTVGAGASGHVALGDPDGAIERGRSAAAAGVAPGTASEPDYVEGAFAQAMISPGIAPWLGARLGLGGDYEAGLTYTGRNVRLDARRAFEKEKLAFSAGLGASAVFRRPGSVARTSDQDDLSAGAGRFAGGLDDVTATGWGLDLPLLVGYESTGQVVQLWAGARAGLEFASVDFPLDLNRMEELGEPGSEDHAPGSASRWYAGGLVGLSVGMHPIWIAIELQAAYVSVSGTVEIPAAFGEPSEWEADMAGWALTPAGAVITKF